MVLGKLNVKYQYEEVLGKVLIFNFCNKLLFLNYMIFIYIENFRVVEFNRKFIVIKRVFNEEKVVEFQ